MAGVVWLTGKWSLIVSQLTVEVFAGNGRQCLAFGACHKGELFGAPGALKPGGLSQVWHWSAQGAIWLVPPPILGPLR